MLLDKFPIICDSYVSNFQRALSPFLTYFTPDRSILGFFIYMGKFIKLLDFQLLRYRASASKLALLSLMFFLLIPSQPFQGEGGHWIELVDYAEDRDASKILRIYSIVKSYRTDLRDASAWAISETILEESKKHSLDPMLVLAVISVESNFQHTAISSKGARGLMQIRPFVADALAQELGLRDKEIKGSKDHPFTPSILKPLNLEDPILNIKLGVFYLYRLKKNFRDVRLALAAYNWGPTEIKNRLAGDEAVPLGYATKVLSTYHSYRKHNRQT